MRHEETVKSHHPSVYTFTHVDNILDDYTLQAAAAKKLEPGLNKAVK